MHDDTIHPMVAANKIGNVAHELHGFLDVMGRCASTNDPRSFDYQLYTTFRRGVKVVHTVFEGVFGPKRTSTIWCYDVMIL